MNAWKVKNVPLITLAALLSGCSLVPQYERPTSPVPSQFANAATKTEQDSTAQKSSTTTLDWQGVLRDQRLQHVVAMALNNNRDLRVALLNIEKARAQYRIEDSALYPSVTAGLTHTASKANGSITRSDALKVGISSWEVDLFGRLDSLSQEAMETYLATQETQRSTRMTLVSEVAVDWLNVWAYQQQLALAQQTYQSQLNTLRLTQEMHRLGAASGVDLASVQSSVFSARGDVALYQTNLEQARNALELVVGTAVPEALLPSDDDIDQAIALAPLTDNLSSDVLLQRPDVLYAEHSLKAANANIGAARAAFFPTISLTATAGRSSEQLSDLFSAGHGTWSFIPSISIPIFNAGELRASLDVAKIEEKVEVAQYEQAIQTAFSEVANAFAVRRRIDERLDAKEGEVAANRKTYQLTDALYRNGADSYLNTLTAQRSYYSTQQELITLKLAELGNRVTLYQVLGGGADAKAESVTQTP
ncbi:efflux transporter outer membrane subunit [Vibrio porteresiae]|uniref:Efflux transporter outer membrane subunit n=1 Tax=Vibrio porteresiae DSM 19223 TaxID=1123496 RepID=A0ABZ0QJM6_9VIBR|nr:efflux transporter outer membrane subunit [Vibrio porteresiae]WPC76412.1 efflux transporter outer membrane subunit [Vibrio porteresiae DSM 19223]